MVNVNFDKIVGQKILLRKLNLSDADSITKHINDKSVARWTLSVPYPYRKEYAVDFIRSRKTGLKNKTNYTFGIAEVADNSIIGCIDLDDIDWEDKKAEIGYWISGKFRRRGYMTEAVNLVLDFGFKKLGLHKIYARVFKSNYASMKVLERNRFKFEGTLRHEAYKNGRWIDELYYGLLKSEFRKLPKR